MSEKFVCKSKVDTLDKALISGRRAAVTVRRRETKIKALALVTCIGNDFPDKRVLSENHSSIISDIGQ